jgi:hypothetical protein
LWLERGPFGTVPPTRQQVDGNVAAFDKLDESNIYVLGSDGKLWLELITQSMGDLSSVRSSHFHRGISPGYDGEQPTIYYH